MHRRNLIIESIMTRQQITRSGNVYNYRRPSGASSINEALNKFLWSVAKSFDFGPIISGDSQQTRQVALDLITSITKQAKRQNIPVSEVKEKLREKSPHIRRGLLNFHSYLDSQLKIK